MNFLSNKKLFYIFYISVIILNIFLVFYLIQKREPWLDEYHTAFVSTLDWSSVFLYIKGDVHPPLYFILIKLWTFIFGESLTALRLFSTSAFLLSAIIFTLTIRKILKNEFINFSFFLIFLFSPALFYYASEARSYSLSVLWATFVVAAVISSTKFHDDFSSENISSISLLQFTRWTHPLSFGLLLSIGFYIHYSNAFISAGVVLTCFIFLKSFRWLFKASIFYILFCSPWILVAFNQLKVKRDLELSKVNSRLDVNFISYDNSFRLDGDSSKYLDILKEFVENFASISGIYPGSLFLLIILSLPFLLIFIIGLISNKDSINIPFVLLITVSLSLLIFFLIVGFSARRYMLPIFPFIIFFYFQSIYYLNKKSMNKFIFFILTFIILICGAGSIRVALANYSHNLEDLVKTLEIETSNNDLVIVNALYAQVPIDIFSGRRLSHLRIRGFPETIYDWWDRQPFKGWGSPTISHQQLSDFISKASEESIDDNFYLILYETGFYDPHNTLLNKLKEKCLLVENISLNDKRKNKYELFKITVPCI